MRSTSLVLASVAFVLPGDVSMEQCGEMRIWMYSVIVRSCSITAIGCMLEFNFGDEELSSFLVLDLEALANLFKLA